MHYLRMKDLEPGVKLAKSITGEDGRVLAGAGITISPTILKRMTSMGFQGAYIDTPGFEDIVIDDVIPDDMRAKAFDALFRGDIMTCVAIAKKMVQEIKYKETLKLDLLDIKNDKNYVYKHCVSVAVFSIVLGVASGLNEEQLENLAVGGLLHDIGKLEIRKKVLNAKHIYNDKEMDEMKKHPMNAYEALKDYPGISSVTRNSILFHHENLDGSGYYGITGDKLGLFPRILRITDTYDALTAQRQYRDAVTPADAIEFIMSNVGTQFDTEIVSMFVKKFPIYPVGFTVKLSNGEVAVVVSNAVNSMRPILRTLTGTTIDLASDPSYRSVLIKEMI